MGVMTVRIFKSFLSRENKTWCNCYEVGLGDQADGTLPDQTGATLNLGLAAYVISQIVTAEKLIHLPAVQFVHATASTWVPDGTPYDPTTMVTTELSGTGEREENFAGETDNLDLRQTLKIKKICASGKLGGWEFRGCIEKPDVIGIGGKLEMDGASFLFDAVAGFIAFLKGAGGLVSAIQPEQGRLVLIGGTLVKTVVPTVKAGLNIDVIKRTYVAPYHIRKVNNVVYGGISMRQTDNKYWDRP